VKNLSNNFGGENFSTPWGFVALPSAEKVGLTRGEENFLVILPRGFLFRKKEIFFGEEATFFSVVPKRRARRKFI